MGLQGIAVKSYCGSHSDNSITQTWVAEFAIDV